MKRKPILFLAVLLLLLAVALVWQRPADESPSAQQPNQREVADSPEHTVKTVVVTDTSSEVAENSNPASTKTVRPRIADRVEIIDRQAVVDGQAVVEQPVITDPRTLRPFGKGASFVIADLPDGILKTQLLALNAEPQAKALKWLHTFTFNGVDAALHLRVDRQGGVFYTCPDDHHNCRGHSHGSKEDEGVAVLQGGGDPAVQSVDEPAVQSVGETAGGETAPPVIESAAVPISSPPAYNSKPGATRHIYLDFNGAVVSGKAWTEGVYNSWDCYAWSTDADFTTFSDSEQAGIRRMWERIAEDYAPFDVNVTTDVTYDPVTYTGDKNKVGWLLITQTTDKLGNPCPHNGSGGVAYVGVFGNSNFFSTYQPAWVAPMGDANTAEAASHEMGHNMGLSHDTTTTNTTGYYNGHGTGDTSWGPIMGTGYNRNVSQWTKGEYYNYYNTQSNDDDLVVISNKVPYRADDHGDSTAAATLISPLADGSLNQTGIIQTTNDPDFFQFSTGAGSITINANPYKCDSQTFGGNLDIILELRNASGTVVATSNPDATTYASITYAAGAGSYYITVKPTGVGTPISSTPTGYTVYGSLGQYKITGNIILPGVSVTESGGSTNVTEGVGNDTYTLSLGTQPTANVTVTITPNSQVTVDKTSVTFTSSNWNTPQTVTVTAVNDSTEEGSHTGTITHTSSSTDGAFNGIGVGSVIANITDNDNVVVTSPNGGQSYYANTTQNIQWSSLMGGNVKIELLKGGSATTIIASTPNNGSYAWLIPQFQTAAADYRIRITSVETPARTDVSNGYFTIIEAPIYFTDLETNPLYTVSGTGWVWGAPTIYSANSGTQAYATNLSGTSWANSVLTSKAIDCSNYTNVQLEYFLRALLMNDPVTYPGVYTCKVEVSNNGTTWGNTAGVSKVVFEQTGMNTGWVKYNYNIADIADGKPTVYIRWSQIKVSGTYQTTNGGTALDDVKLTGTYTSPVTTYSVTYSGNGSTGGSVPVDTAKYEQGATVAVLGNTGNLTRTGYVFSKWNTKADGTGSNYLPNATFPMGAANVTLYAVWTQSYSVTYNGNGSNGGSVPVDGNSYLPAATVTVLGNTNNLSRTGYVFSKWNTKADGTGADYLPNATFAIGSANVTLYAKWTLVQTYTVAYNANGGTSPPANQLKTQGVDLILAGVGSMVKTGYTFVGWNTVANGSGGTPYAAGANYTTDAALTLYAQWQVSTYAIAYSGNGQTGGSSPTDQIKTHNVNVTISGPASLVRDGYTFAGWNTSPNGSGTSYSGGAVYTGNANLDLYAKWTPDTYTVTYVGNGYTGGSVPANQTKTHDVDLTLAGVGTLVRTSTTFGGWNTAADGSGVAYAGGATYSGNTDITLYAQWRQSVTVLQENFESPATPTAYSQGTLPDNGNWVGANDGASGSKSTQHGITDKAGGDFTASNPNQQAYAFKNTNTGITTAASKIGTLTDKATYTVTFDVIPLSGSGNSIYTNYRVQLIAFAAGAVRNDCRTTPSTSLVLKDVSGTIDGAGISFSYTRGDITDAAYLGYDLGVRFIGSGSSGVIDNVSVQVSSLASPPAFDVWSGGGGGFSADSNGDGIDNGMAWVLGATNTSANATALLPVLDNATDPTYFIYTYRRSDSANADASTSIAVEYSSDLTTWTEALDPDPNVIITETNDGYGAGVDKVEVKINRTLAVGQKIFSRLKVVITP